MRYLRKHAATRLLLVLALFVALMPSTPAQKGTVVTRRVQFSRGRTSTVLKGRAEWGTAYTYLLNARAGQSMSVEITGIPGVTIRTPDPNHKFDIEEGSGGVKRWSGDLPATGTYKLIVSHTADGVRAAPYTLKNSVQSH
jgi:hypothetical protein